MVLLYFSIYPQLFHTVGTISVAHPELMSSWIDFSMPVLMSEDMQLITSL